MQEADWLGGETREAGCKRHHSDREQFWAVIRGEAADGSAEHGLGEGTRGHKRRQRRGSDGRYPGRALRDRLRGADGEVIAV